MREGFYNTNRFRALPFRKESVGQPLSGPVTLRHLPDAAIVDAGFVCGADSGFDPTVHKIYLTQLRRQGDTFSFDFECDAPQLAGLRLTFTRNLSDALYVLEDSDGFVVGSDSSGSSVGACGEPRWWGYLVTGDMTSLDGFLASNGSVDRGVATDALLEPALVQSLANAYVTAVNLANDDRTRADSPDGCDAIVFPYQVGGIYLNASCLEGLIVLKPGFNCSLRQNDLGNEIVFSAAVGAGEGEPCAEVPLFADETPPAGSSLLTGGLLCNEALRAINGSGGRQITLIGRGGVSVTPVPEENTVIVDVNMTSLATCFASSTGSETLC